jgi:hypothetical protein
MIIDTTVLLNNTNITLLFNKNPFRADRVFSKKGLQEHVLGVRLRRCVGNLKVWNLSFYHIDTGVYYEIKF